MVVAVQDISDADALAPPDWLRMLHGTYREIYTDALAAREADIAQVRRDGLDHILPVLLVTGQSVQHLRATLGRTVWRNIHHASETTNFLRSLIWLRFKGDADWAGITAIPQVHLRSCRNAVDWPTARIASRLAEPGTFLRTAMLYRDCLRLGGTPAPHWTLPRLKREHDSLAIRAAIEAADTTPWADPWTTTIAGHVFTRLITDRDLVTEGKLQRHCIATYRDDARAGACVALRCTGAERATLCFDSKGRYELQQFANAPVSPECRAAALQAMADFNAAFKMSAIPMTSTLTHA